MWRDQYTYYWVRVNKDGTQKKLKNVGSGFKEKHIQDDYMFKMRQLKGLKLSHIILKYVNILPAKFYFDKSEAEQS